MVPTGLSIDDHNDEEYAKEHAEVREASPPAEMLPQWESLADNQENTETPQEESLTKEDVDMEEKSKFTQIPEVPPQEGLVVNIPESITLEGELLEQEATHKVSAPAGSPPKHVTFT